MGHQCVECVRTEARTVRQPRTHFGGRQRSNTPVITYALIAVNVLMFILQTASVDVERRLTLGSPAVADGDLYRLVTSAFLHFGVTHLLFNMWALYVVGTPLEASLGRLRFSALYLLSALGGSVLVYLLSPLNAATAGASGAVFGLFGATFVVGRRLNLDVRWVVVLIAINLVITLHHPGNQLAGPRRRAGHRCADRCGLRVCAPRTPKPHSGSSDGRGGGVVHGADLVAHKRSSGAARGACRPGLTARSRRCLNV